MEVTIRLIFLHSNIPARHSSVGDGRWTLDGWVDDYPLRPLVKQGLPQSGVARGQS
jgi:hypothetical protein